jgi:hypothetical protein
MQPELSKVNVVATTTKQRRSSTKTTADTLGLITTQTTPAAVPAQAGKQAHTGADTKNNHVSTAPDKNLKELANRFELYLAYGLILLFIAVFALGRVYWDDRYYIPDEGVGYALGMTGGIMMLLALGYSLFKRTAFLRKLFGLKAWLHVHIIFGIVGPLLVVLHSTFRIGSLNGGVALISMLLVFLSGVIGRFLYSKIHFGLGGQKAKIKDLQEMLQNAGEHINSKRLETFTHSYVKKPSNLLTAGFQLVTYGWRSRFLYFNLIRKAHRHIKAQSLKQGWDSTTSRKNYRAYKHALRYYFYILKKVALFSLYERFFAFWRHAHVPLLYLLLISGILHVFAVHMY